MKDKGFGAGLACLLWVHAACETASPLSSVTAFLRVEKAQLVPGPPPADGQGPRVQSVTLLQAQIWPGQLHKPLGGVLDSGATAVSLYLVGDPSHFILPAGPPDVAAPEQPTFAALLAFSPDLPVGPQTLLLQATDSQGRYGSVFRQSVQAVEDPSLQGALVITLRWQRPVDLDLHVEEPGGSEIWARRKGGMPPPNEPPTEDTGYLDADSNAQCALDGRQRESVIYPGAAPRGRYRVRVDTFSLCGQNTAYWQLEVQTRGRLLTTARGQSLPSSTRGPHGQGAGVLALEVDIP